MQKYRLVFLIIFPVVFLSSIFAQTNFDGFIVGHITERTSGHLIAGAQIRFQTSDKFQILILNVFNTVTTRVYYFIKDLKLFYFDNSAFDLWRNRSIGCRFD